MCFITYLKTQEKGLFWSKGCGGSRLWS